MALAQTWVKFDSSFAISISDGFIYAQYHGLVNGDEVIFTPIGGLPVSNIVPLKYGKMYFVEVIDGDYFNIKETSDGANISFTQVGAAIEAYKVTNKNLSALDFSGLEKNSRNSKNIGLRFLGGNVKDVYFWMAGVNDGVNDGVYADVYQFDNPQSVSYKQDIVDSAYGFDIAATVAGTSTHVTQPSNPIPLSSAISADYRSDGYSFPVSITVNVPDSEAVNLREYRGLRIMARYTTDI